MKLYSLRELERDFEIPFRYAKHLIFNRHLKTVVKDGRVFVTEESLKEYLAKPKTERKTKR